MQSRIWFGLIGQFLVMALALFGGAGTFAWPAGWTFLFLYVVLVTAMSLRLAKVDPGLLEERVKVGAQEDQPLWDRFILRVLGLLILAWLIVSGLDAVRFTWSNVPFRLQVVGGVVAAASLVAVYRIMRRNSYLAPTVHVQRERGHAVISSGAYGVVRHPFYAMLIPFFAGAALLLGSYAGVFVSALIALLLGFRCVREERHLQLELEGYASYLDTVRYRLIPYIW